MVDYNKELTELIRQRMSDKEIIRSIIEKMYQSSLAIDKAMIGGSDSKAFMAVGVLREHLLTLRSFIDSVDEMGGVRLLDQENKAVKNNKNREAKNE